MVKSWVLQLIVIWNKNYGKKECIRSFFKSYLTMAKLAFLTKLAGQEGVCRIWKKINPIYVLLFSIIFIVINANRKTYRLYQDHFGLKWLNPWCPNSWTFAKFEPQITHLNSPLKVRKYQTQYFLVWILKKTLSFVPKPLL